MHTPGPWFYDVDGPGWDLHVTAGAPYYIRGAKSVAFWSRSAADRAGHAERSANARLIAAAPDLLAALTAAAVVMEANGLSTAKLAREVIAKATGVENAPR